MKILVITSGYLPMPPVKGGAVENLLYNYISNDSLNEFVVYSCFDNSLKNHKENNIEYRYINTTGIKYKILNFITKILDRILFRNVGNQFIINVKKDLKIKKEVYDIVLIENNPAYVLPLKKIFDGKIILHVHNDWLNKNVYRAKSIKKNCKCIYVVSEYVKNRVGDIDNDFSNIRVLMNGIDSKRFSKPNSIEKIKELRNKYNIKDEDIIFMYSGKINEAKGADLLVNSFLQLSKKYSNIKLLLLGSSFNKDASDSSVIKQLKNNCKSNSAIIFTGFVDYNAIHDYYALADIQIVPSQIEDSCPLVVLEGLCSGNALIVSDSGGIPELVDDSCSYIIKRGKNFETELVTKMEYLINNRKTIIKMQKSAKLRSRLFSLERYISDFAKYNSDFYKQ